MLMKKLGVIFSCGTLLTLVALDYVDAVSKVETYINQKYQTPRAKRIATENLDKIDASQQSKADKIAALKKEFPGAFSEAPAPIKDNSLIYVPVVSYKIHSLSIGYDIKESASSQTKTVDLVKQASEASVIQETSITKSFKSQHQAGAGVDVKIETTLNPLRWLKDAFNSDTGSHLKISAKYQYDYNSSSNASELWGAKQQQLFQRNREQLQTLIQNTAITNRHLTFTVTLYNGSDKTLACDLSEASLPVYMGNQSCNKGAKPYGMSGNKISLYPGMSKDITFRMELDTTTALELVRFMSSAAPTVRLAQGILPIKSTDGSISNAIASSMNAPATFTLTLVIPGYTAEWKIRYLNADGKKTTLRQALQEIQEMFLRKTARELFTFAEDGSLEKISGCQTRFDSDGDLTVFIQKGSRYIDSLSKKELDESADLDGYQIKILSEEQIQKEKDPAFQKFVFEKVRQLAEDGKVEAQAVLGALYAIGYGVKENPDKAFEWLLKSAEQGNADAQCALAGLYFEGIGTTKDERKAFEWCRKSAEQGDADAQYGLANLYFLGMGTEKDMRKAFEWLLKSAEQGNADAQCALAGLYLEGIGTEKDMRKAFEWFLKSAEQGDADAQCALSGLYAEGIGTEKDMRKAFEWCRKSAEQGNAEAQLGLANLYFDGMGTAKDVRKAFEWYRKSAEQGNADAQYGLACCYIRGLGVAENRAEGIVWLRQAAKQGNEQAQKDLKQLE